MTDHFLEARPDDARVLMMAAELAEQRGDQEDAIEIFDRVAELENLPVSIQGFMRLSLRREAMYRRARTKVDRFLSGISEAEGESF